MKLITSVLLLAVVALVVSCGVIGGDKAATKDTRTAAEVVADLKSKGLPIVSQADFTAESDPEKLLGRPGQYTSRTNFHDSRVFSLEILGIAVQAGGAVEVFDNESDATRRRTYLETIAKVGAVFTEYDYQLGNVLLRLSRSLTPDQAKAYADAFGVK